MDERGVDEMGTLDVSEGAHLHGKENECPTKPSESYILLESREIAIPGEDDYCESSFHVLANVLGGKDINRSGSAVEGSEQPCTTPRYMDDADNMVEELMVRDFDSSNLAIVGTSNNREKMQTRQGQWQHHSQQGHGSGIGSSRTNNFHRDNGQNLQSVWEDVGYTPFPEFFDQKASSDDCNQVMEPFVNTSYGQGSENMTSHSGMRTKIFSKSGFSEFFVKNTLKGKGIVLRGPPQGGMKLESRDTNNRKAAAGTSVCSNASQVLGVDTMIPSYTGFTGPIPGGSVHDGVNLREWLNYGRQKVTKVECLRIFRQILDLVDCSHAHGVALHNLRLSSFKLLCSNQVKYIDSIVERDASEVARVEDKTFSNNMVKRQPLELGMFPSLGVCPKKQKLDENMNHTRQWPQFTPRYWFKVGPKTDVNISVANTKDISNEANVYDKYANRMQATSTTCRLSNVQPLTSVSDQLEDKWYASPEEQTEGICTISSNVYSLGVLLFELLGHFESERAHAVAMLELRHRILPPRFLSENQTEAGFCLWLLHPEASSRPTTREILQSELITGLQEVSAEKLSYSVDQDDAESELLMHFLVSLKDHKQKQSAKLVEDIRSLDVDIEEVERSHPEGLVHSSKHGELVDGIQSSAHRECLSFEPLSPVSFSSNANKTKFMNNISQLESAYFSMRSKIQSPETDVTIRHDRDLLKDRENCCLAQMAEEGQTHTDRVGAFFDGLCKYARYSKFEVRGLLRTGDFNSSANVICSLSFDRDADYFAAAGVSKKIKVFEFDALFNDSVDIHYPVIEMSNKSKLSCICWNNYIKNYLASTGYDGVVKLWDVSTGQGLFQYSEHEKRAWSVDFSQVYPTKLASGSDDCSVKLWNINEKNSIATIRSIANICCVQFSSHSTHLLAFGSADYRTYCYDLRNVRTPWCVLPGHNKTVSYVKFVGSDTLVTASTDNSLKLWNLNKTHSSGLSTNDACSLTLSGHTNDKNFVGLSVSDGYIACGSETNEVYAYYRSLPIPITSHKFGSIDPISGKETDDDNGQFVSSVCWRGKSDTVIAANSSGCIKVLRMV
ncbi:hypothetical protein K2173_010344 [Erythroxylum novogranatense]|uniref:Protein SPA1-RELATED 2 n=1 Tax=Erythroxylum novogranatense TaxID=1862640 RepID=A0AAV8TFY2_9ROSI|nr:hypothetical protein K2173_010344 [Erythroxylum novogranatense]